MAITDRFESLDLFDLDDMRNVVGEVVHLLEAAILVGLEKEGGHSLGQLKINLSGWTYSSWSFPSSTKEEIAANVRDEIRETRTPDSKAYVAGLTLLPALASAPYAEECYPSHWFIKGSADNERVKRVRRMWNAHASDEMKFSWHGN